MAHDADLIVTITVALVVACIGGYLAARLRLPPIVGFLAAGVVLGPFTPGFNADTEIAGQLAEIGIILLMFGVGIHFSFKDLLAVQSVALPGAILEVILITALVTPVAMMWGWSIEAGIVLGLAASIASTVILVHTLTERDELETPVGQIAVGWLIVEDLLTVLALVLIPILLGNSGSNSSSEDSLAMVLALTVGKVIVLAVFMIVVGVRVVPWLLVQVARTGSRELFMLSVLSVALGIAYVSASFFDVSFALGAFLAGLVISESDLSHHAAAEALPMQDAFAVLFFVSVGMLFDWHFLLESPDLIISILAIIVLFKPLATLVILTLFHYPSRMGLTIGASRGQIGEFSFILAGLGITEHIIPSDGYSLILAGAILSITMNPALFKSIDPLDRWLRRRPPVMRYLDQSSLTSTWPPVNVVPHAELRGHAVLIGCGRVGSVISQALERRGFRQIVVEQNRRRVEEVRQRGLPVLYGDCANPGLISQMNLDRARVLIIAIPDPIATRLTVEAARTINPHLPVVVRTHSATERERLVELGVNEAVLGELELALEMTRFTMRRFGVGGNEIQAILQGLRAGSARTTSDQDL